MKRRRRFAAIRFNRKQTSRKARAKRAWKKQTCRVTASPFSKGFAMAYTLAKAKSGKMWVEADVGMFANYARARNSLASRNPDGVLAPIAVTGLSCAGCPYIISFINFLIFFKGIKMVHCLSTH